MAEASDEFNIADPCRKLDNVSTCGHRTYTYEEPNAIKPADVPRFLARDAHAVPRPLRVRSSGSRPGCGRVRTVRSDGRVPTRTSSGMMASCLFAGRTPGGSEMMESTKPDRDQIIDLDPEQIALACRPARTGNKRRDRRASDIAAAQRGSDLLFPAAPTRWSHGGGFRSPSCLDRPFDRVAEILQLGYKVSPRCMRPTFRISPVPRASATSSRARSAAMPRRRCSATTRRSEAPRCARGSRRSSTS